MGQLEGENPTKGDDSPKASIDHENSLRQRPLSRTLSEQTSHFEEISLDSPDVGDDKKDSLSSVVSENNNIIKMTDLSKKDVQSPSDSDETDTKHSEVEDEKPKSVPFSQLFRFASTNERILVGIGILASIAGGCSMPVMIILFGQLADAFVTQAQNAPKNSTQLSGCFDQNNDFNIALPTCQFDAENIETDRDHFYAEIAKFGTGAAIIGLVNLVSSYLFVTCLNHAAEAQVFRIRTLFLKSVLRQDIGWYDVHQTGDFASRMADDLNKLQEGIGEKIGMFIFFMTIFSASLINAFIHGWELTLVIFSAMPVLIIAVSICARATAALTAKELNIYGKAGAIAEEVLSSIRTVIAFGGEEKEIERYDGKLAFARQAGVTRGTIVGVGAGLMWFIIYGSYALAFWYGVKLIMDDREICVNDPENCQARYTPASLLIVFFSVLMGAMNVGQASPYIEAFSMAKGAAAMIFDIIDRKPVIDSFSEEGLRPGEVKGKIQLSNVKFNYPSRMEVDILKGLSITIEPGQTVALVGPSGCGKSTVVQLVQRFYDPLNGSVMLDGLDLKNINVGWLRDRIGTVGQEPVLFGTSIIENIRFGREGVTDEEIEKACKEANAYGFIQKLPKKLETLVGDKGAQLSGGQKQRIAIARALVRNPSILLLDEATSALDSASEACVQAALDKAKTGRTTIIVAHRLSTVRSSDKIVAINNGMVEEEGTHDELMAKKGLYYSLVTTQMNSKVEDELVLDDKEEDVIISNDALESLNLEESEMPSLISIGSFTGTFGRKKSSVAKLDRRISVLSNYSTYSEDSFGFEDALGAATSAIAIARAGSTRTSRRSKKSVVRMDSETAIVPELEETLVEVDTARIVKMNLPEWPYVLVGLLGSIVMGGAMPVYAILFGEVLGVLKLSSEEAREQSVYFCSLFLAAGVTAGIAVFLQVTMFCIAGEHLTQRMRKLAFSAMLRQEMGWFDQPENSVGALLSRLSADSGAIQGATGSRVGAILHAVFTLLISITTSLVLEWRLGLVGCAFVPLVLIGTFAQSKIIIGHDNLEKKALQKASKLAIEAITNIRTVASLRKETYFVEQYNKELARPHASSKSRSHLRGIVFGFAQSVPFFAYGGCMFYGGYLVYYEGIPYKIVFKVAEALILGTMMVGQASAFAPNYNKAMIAAARIFSLLDRKPKIDSAGGSGLRLNKVDGDAEFKDAVFSYPTRKTVRVLQNLDLGIKKGQSVALVGPSGCGKSTVIQLIQRFYDLNSGEITLEKHDLNALNVPWVRSKLSIVSQEPILFNRTLAENIAYGDNSKEVTMEDIIQAARKANIHQFISNLPQGYETSVGEKGTQLSGGQKQRIAIARALIRNPPILLLDEATSALDMESEKQVQSALDSAQEGRTSITIAHRLSTVKNCDIIFVVNQGRIDECGTHEELLQKKRTYYKLWTTQTGGKK